MFTAHPAGIYVYTGKKIMLSRLLLRGREPGLMLLLQGGVPAVADLAVLLELAEIRGKFRVGLGLRFFQIIILFVSSLMNSA